MRGSAFRFRSRFPRWRVSAITGPTSRTCLCAGDTGRGRRLEAPRAVLGFYLDIDAIDAGCSGDMYSSLSLSTAPRASKSQSWAIDRHRWILRRCRVPREDSDRFDADAGSVPGSAVV